MEYSNETLYNVTSTEYLYHMKIAELNKKVELLKLSYGTYSNKNTELTEIELNTAIAIGLKIKKKKLELNRWVDKLKNLKET
jgi:hypothetical protein